VGSVWYCCVWGVLGGGGSVGFSMSAVVGWKANWSGGGLLARRWILMKSCVARVFAAVQGVCSEFAAATTAIVYARSICDRRACQQLHIAGLYT
jgi:hypothetical protein